MNSNTVGAGAGSGQQAAGWLDFYAMLGVSPQADSNTLRKGIGEAYAEATANIDHRDLNRRHYFQTMVEQVLPQCRRVLLDPTLRSRYDEENARHAAGDAAALDYVSFMASMQGASADSARQAVARTNEFDLLPERVRDEINLARAVIEAVQSGSEFDLLPARTLSSAPAAAQAAAQASTPLAEPGAPLAAPGTASPEDAGEASRQEASAREVSGLRTRPAPRPRPQPAADEYMLNAGSGALSGLGDTMPVDEVALANRPAAQASAQASAQAVDASTSAGLTGLDEPAANPMADRLAQLRDDARKRRRPEAEPEAQPRDAHAAAQAAVSGASGASGASGTSGRAVTEVPNSSEPQIRAKVIDLEVQGKSVAQLRQEAQARAVSGDVEFGTARREQDKKPYRSRVSVDEAPRAARGRRAVLSPIATHVATGVAAAAFIGIILSSTRPVPAVARAPLNVIYSSELRPVLEAAKAQFETSPEGQGTEVVLVPQDSRSAMSTILSPAPGTNAPDVWIPSEAVWSNRFNDVAPGFKRRPISAGSGLALSPLVLVARSDQASALSAKFPRRLIPSWSVLRQMVAQNCAQHFGMTDPEESGAGALVRTAMAREWCDASKVPFGPQTMRDPRLWSWMNGFEKNVPQYKMAGDMVADLARGTTAQYWWALVYESDAIYWIGQGKPLEVFYLPSTFYADHPFCRTERAGTTPAIGAAAARFEKFLRSAPLQQAFLQGGFRAPEIDLTSKIQGNPFQSADYARRGVRVAGFPVGGRLDYGTVNALVAAWKTRPSS